MAVSASASGGYVSFTVAQAKPGCTVSVDVSSGPRTVSTSGVADGSGSFSSSVLFRGRGLIDVDAASVSCDAAETAGTTIQGGDPRVNAPGSTDVGQRFRITAAGFPPNTQVTFVATLGGRTVTRVDTSQDNGFVRVNMSLPTAGVWVITAVGGGVFETTTITVR